MRERSQLLSLEISTFYSNYNTILLFQITLIII